MTDLRANPEALRATHPRFDDICDRVKTAAAQLHRVIDAEGKCWGADEIGESFAKDYVPGAESALKGTDRLAEVIERVGDNVVITANTLEARDLANAAKTNQIT
ncbi:hypothetical protein OG203_11025 [Nocardia sp. NBC_01499]|uniref:WXG100 family type VII secretion target n=1 Tax=Nocardia sp. NBC_01499 TaxID=2903597 RepID=UPI003868965C